MKKTIIKLRRTSSGLSKMYLENSEWIGLTRNFRGLKIISQKVE